MPRTPQTRYTPQRADLARTAMGRCLLLALITLVMPLSISPAVAHEVEGYEVDWQTVARIRAEGLENSQVMATLRHLTDDIGPRLTGSPAMKEANEWTRDRLTDWGLANAQLEQFGPFGRGWTFSRAAVHMLSPRATPLRALPKAWTRGTDGPQIGSVLKVRLESEKDLEEWRGKLSGKILWSSSEREIREDEPAFDRYESHELEQLRSIDLDSGGRDFSARMASFRTRMQMREKVRQFLVDEGVLATVEMSDRDNGIVRVTGGGSRELDEDPGPPALVMAAEHYRLVSRLLDAGEEVTLELDVASRFHDEDTMAYNTVAELPGSDKRDEIVIVGGHLDSWHAGTGSNDNAAGVAVAMEAMRILAAIEAKPRRTIRIGLWSGEEQGLLGARAYVAKHFAERPENTDPETRDLPRFLQPLQWPIDYKPAWDDFQAYFNLDNGAGRIRGIYTQSNAALVPIFRAWLEPLEDLGATTVTNRNTGGTDHQAFDAVALPGFQFIQDRLDYSSRTHHTELDHYDHARAADLEQAAVVMATFAYQAAISDELLPRKAKPQPPADTAEEGEEQVEETNG